MRESAVRPLHRKVVVGASRGAVRELLRQAARGSPGWIGFEATTPRPLALEIAGSALAKDGLRVLDEFDLRALIDQAADSVLVDAPRYGRLSELADRVGLRDRLHAAVHALRAAGIGPERVRASNLRDRAKRDALAAVLDHYLRALRQCSGVDGAGVIERACTVLEAGGGEFPDEHTKIYLVPGLMRRGLEGRLLSALQARGAVALEADPVCGMSPPAGRTWSAGAVRSGLSYLHDVAEGRDAVGRGPTGSDLTTPDLAFFAAASVTQELREVLRRVVALGVGWDEVEIVCTDPRVYGSALHALAEQLDIPVTFGTGLPLARTRPGRAVTEYFRWIEGGFAEADFRRLLEAGDVRPPARHAGVSAMALARRLRSLRIGWGRERYGRLLSEALDTADSLPPGRYESESAHRRRREIAARELRALRAILAPVLRSVPPVPRPVTGATSPPVSPAALAKGLRTFLRFVPVDHPVDATAAERLDRILVRVAATLDRPTEYAWAAAALRHHLDLRVPAPEAEGRAPWGSEGGHLFLTDVEHGGVSGRPVTFVVGMDAARFPGGGVEDPLLVDGDRVRLGGEALPNTAARLYERRFQFAGLCARIRGRLTVSYAEWDPAEARAQPPSASVLDLFRFAHRDPTLTYEDLRTALGPTRGLIPADAVLDGHDVWIRALSRDRRLIQGTHLVRRAFPRLARGMDGLGALDGADASPFLGVLTPRPELDPRNDAARPMSASRLEALGRCPRRYMFESVLNLRPPDDLRADPDQWLDPMARGSLLHEVYDRTLREARERDISFEDPAFEKTALAVLEECIATARAAYPSPGDAVQTRQIRQLEEDVRSFVLMVRERGAPWLATEVRFGLATGDAVSMPVPGGDLALRGIVDRVDEREGSLVIVDYKTGSTFAYGAKRGVFANGRRLQHLVYVAAMGRLYSRSVSGMEYHFPTRRSENQVVPFPERSLRLGPEIVGHLLDSVRDGRFVPTDDADDCRFCDYRPICRVRVTEWTVESPFAAWSRAHRETLDAFTSVNRARRVEDEGEGFGQLARVDGMP